MNPTPIRPEVKPPIVGVDVEELLPRVAGKMGDMMMELEARGALIDKLKARIAELEEPGEQS
jgi:hypothetical protein